MPAPTAWTPTCPLLIPEVNPDHLQLVPHPAQEPRLGQGFHRHRPQLLDHRPGAGAQAAPRRLWRAPPDRDHDAGPLRRGLSRRALAGHPGQRRALHRQRRGQDGARAAQAAGPLFRGAGHGHSGGDGASARPATASPPATATWRPSRWSSSASATHGRGVGGMAQLPEPALRPGLPLGGDPTIIVRSEPDRPQTVSGSRRGARHGRHGGARAPLRGAALEIRGCSRTTRSAGPPAGRSSTPRS